jgi:hypothetical protein
MIAERVGGMAPGPLALGRGVAEVLHTILARQRTVGRSHGSARGGEIVRQNARLWMAVGFCVTLGVTVTGVGIFYTQHKNLGIALAISARVAFLFFWPAYVGSTLRSLFGNVFALS